MKKTGFTLIEILIVIGIIAVLASAAIIAINPGHQFSATRDNVRDQHINSLYSSLISYRISNHGWSNIDLPEEFTEICNSNLDDYNCGNFVDLSILVEDGYISEIPVDPQGSDSEEYDGTGYFIARGSVMIVAGRSESGFLGVGITEEEYLERIEGGSGDDVELADCDDYINYEGYNYEIAQIGGQCWFAEDLQYDDGCTENDWSMDEPYDACDSPLASDYDSLYYQWDAAMAGSEEEGGQGLCPDGWRVPTMDDFEQLEDYVSAEYDGGVGDQLKDPEAGWCSDSNNCGETGFNALPVGMIYSEVYYEAPFGDDYYGSWWSSYSHPEWPEGADHLTLTELPEFDVGESDKHLEYAVRCVEVID